MTSEARRSRHHSGHETKIPVSPSLKPNHASGVTAGGVTVPRLACAPIVPTDAAHARRSVAIATAVSCWPCRSHRAPGAGTTRPRAIPRNDQRQDGRGAEQSRDRREDTAAHRRRVAARCRRAPEKGRATSRRARLPLRKVLEIVRRCGSLGSCQRAIQPRGSISSRYYSLRRVQPGMSEKRVTTAPAIDRSTARAEEGDEQVVGALVSGDRELRGK